MLFPVIPPLAVRQIMQADIVWFRERCVLRYGFTYVVTVTIKVTSIDYKLYAHRKHKKPETTRGSET
jgi:hypothetical protein